MHPSYSQKMHQGGHGYNLLNFQKVYQGDEQNDTKKFEISGYPQITE